MQRLPILLAAAGLCVAFYAATAEAQQPRRFRPFGGDPVKAAPAPSRAGSIPVHGPAAYGYPGELQPGRHPAMAHPATARPATPSRDAFDGGPWEWFPKYYGGFHARYFQDLGLPRGSIGVRGDAW